jgi:hypothetical protein
MSKARYIIVLNQPFSSMQLTNTRKCDEIDKEVFRIYDAVNIYESMGDYSDMKPVVNDPRITFKQLEQEIKEVDSESMKHLAKDQFIAKLQRKKRHLDENQTRNFETKAGLNPDDFIKHIETKYNFDINIGDTISILKHVSGINTLSDYGFSAGDLDNNNAVDIADVVSILKHVSGIDTLGESYGFIDNSGQAVNSLSDNGTIQDLYIVAKGDIDESGGWNAAYSELV